MRPSFLTLFVIAVKQLMHTCRLSTTFASRYSTAQHNTALHPYNNTTPTTTRSLQQHDPYTNTTPTKTQNTKRVHH